jgi:hypothetical protein
MSRAVRKRAEPSLADANELDVDEAAGVRPHAGQCAIEPRRGSKQRLRQQRPRRQPAGQPIAQRRVRLVPLQKKTWKAALELRAIATEDNPAQRPVCAGQRASGLECPAAIGRVRLPMRVP